MGTDTFQVSLIKHADEANWDRVGSKPSVYLAVKPKHCTYEGESDLFFTLTGARLSTWKCSP
jgi:hypothetical protein